MEQNKLVCLYNHYGNRTIQEYSSDLDKLDFKDLIRSFIESHPNTIFSKLYQETNDETIVLNIRPTSSKNLVSLEDKIKPYLVTKKTEHETFYYLEININIFSVIG